MKYKYGNIADAKPGDIVECITDWSKHGTDKGSLHIVKKLADSGICIKDNRSDSQAYARSFLKLVLTKPGSEAKVDDMAIRTTRGIGSCPTGTVFEVTHMNDMRLGYKPDHSAGYEECLILQTEDESINNSCDHPIFKPGMQIRRTSSSASGLKHGYVTTLLKVYKLDNGEFRLKLNDAYGKLRNYCSPNSWEVADSIINDKPLAYYKRSGEPWTEEETKLIPKFWEAPSPASDYKRKYIYHSDAGNMYLWTCQAESYILDKFNAVAFEDHFKLPSSEPEFTYPMWFKKNDDNKVCKFTSLRNCEVITQGTGSHDQVGRKYKSSAPHTRSGVWTQIDEPISSTEKLYSGHSLQYWEDRYQAGHDVWTTSGSPTAVKCNGLSPKDWSHPTDFHHEDPKLKDNSMYIPKYKIGDVIQTDYNWYPDSQVIIADIQEKDNVLMYIYEATSGTETGSDICSLTDAKSNFYLVSTSEPLVEIPPIPPGTYYIEEGTITTFRLDNNSTPCYLSEINIQPQKENTMKENITVTMSAKEYAKHTKAEKAKPTSDFKLRKPFTVKCYYPNGALASTKEAKSLKAAERVENEYLQDASAGSRVVISEEISCRKRKASQLEKA